jgi:hypothetical protein
LYSYPMSSLHQILYSFIPTTAHNKSLVAFSLLTQMGRVVDMKVI